jgi:flavine halogenase
LILLLIGESLIPSVRHYLRFIDAEKKVEGYGFARKVCWHPKYSLYPVADQELFECAQPGAAIKFTQHKREGYTDFLALGHNANAWNVPRSEFDALLLEHASCSGVRVFQQTKVTELHFEPHHGSLTSIVEGSSRAVGASYLVDEGDGKIRQGRITFDYVVDASGRAGIISTKYLKNRAFTESLK